MKKSRQINLSHPPAIVIGLDHIVGLQTARLLVSKGIPVYGIAKNKKHFCAKTSVCENIFYGDTTGEELIPLLEKIRKEFPSKPVLFPCRDLSVLLLSRNRDRLEDLYRFALPPAEMLEMLMDKIKFYKFASDNNLPVPKYFLLHNRGEAMLAMQNLDYPCTIKPAIKTPLWESKTKMKAFKISNPEEFIELYDNCSAWTDTLIAQEWVIGKDSNNYSCNTYFDFNCEPKVTFIAKKLRQWPVETGNTSLGVECREDEVLDQSVKFFMFSQLYGLGYLEMKKDDRNGKFYIIEPNIGRPTGRSAIAEAGGVDLLYTMYCDLTGLPLPENRTQLYTGVKWIHLRADLLSSINYWLKKELSFFEWLKSISGKKTFAVFSLKDPLPFLHEIAQGFVIMTGAVYKKLAPAKRKIENTTDWVPLKNTSNLTKYWKK